MSGVILATAIGSGVAAAGGTAAVVAAGIGAGTTLYGGAKSFSDANKARKRGEAAERAADKAIEEAKRRVDVNAYEQLSIAKEPYELMRDALLTQGATGMQAGVEGETRGAAATAGRMQMAQNLRQGQVRGEMGQRMDEINKLVAGEDKRRQLQLAGIAMEETAGAQLAVRDAEEDRAAYIAQGVGTLGGIAEGLSSSYAEGNFGQGRRYTPDGLANTAETIRAGDLGQNRGYELADGSVLNPNIDPDAYAAFGGTVPTGLEADAQVRQGRRAARQFARQDRRAANDIQRAQAQNQRALNRLEGQPFLPPGAATPSPMQPRMVQSSVNSPVLQPLAGPQARIVPQAGTTRTSGPLDPFDPFGGGGFTPPSPVNATRAEARASVAPAGVGGPVAPAPAPERRPVEARASITSGDRETARRRMEANIEATSGLTGAELVKAKEGVEVTEGDDGKFTATYTPPARESRAGVQSVGETETARDLLERLAGKESQEVVAPDPTPKQVEEVTTKSVESAASVGPATEEVVRRVTENANPDNPLPIAMQWLDVKELDPEGVELRSTLWSTIHGKADTTAMVDDNWAWCAALVNHTLTEAGADTLVTDDPYDKGRAKAYETFGKSVEGSNTKTMLGNAKPGDIVVKKKMVPERDKNGKLTGRMKVQYHVGFFSGYDAENGTVNLLGGNQNDEVNITAYPIEQVTAVRRIRVDALTDEEKESMSKIMIKQEGGTR